MKKRGKYKTRGKEFTPKLIGVCGDCNRKEHDSTYCPYLDRKVTNEHKCVEFEEREEK